MRGTITHISECPDCGCTDFFIRKASYNSAIYCRNCGKVVGRIKGERDIRAMARKMLEYEKKAGNSNKYSLKIMNDINGVTQYRCSNCKCLLFTSADPESGGQISLKDDAKYCPMCGNEFLFTISK